MTGRELLKRFENACNLDAEVFVNTTGGEFRVFDLVGTMNDEITIECVNPDTGNTMEEK